MTRALAWGIIAVSLSCAGCAGSSKGGGPQASPTRYARETAARFFEERMEKLRTIHAGLELRWVSAELERPLSCRGSLIFQTPNLLNLRGTSKAFFTIFDLTAGPDEIWIDVPREKILIRGERDDPQWSHFALDPDLVIIALLAHPDLDGNGSIEMSEDGADLVIEGDGTRMEINGQTGLPHRFLRQSPRAEVIWEDWDEVDRVAWPRRIRLIWEEDEEALEIDFGRTQFGKAVRKGYFSELPDDPREVLSPREGIERWAQILEDQQGNL